MATAEELLIKDPADFQKPDIQAAIARWRRLLANPPDSPTDPSKSMLTSLAISHEQLGPWNMWWEQHQQNNIPYDMWKDKLIYDQFAAWQQSLVQAVPVPIPHHTDSHAAGHSSAHLGHPPASQLILQEKKNRVAGRWVNIENAHPELKACDSLEKFTNWQKDHPEIPLAVWHAKKYADANAWRALEAEHPELKTLSTRKLSKENSLLQLRQDGKVLTFADWQKNHPTVPAYAWKWQTAAQNQVSHLDQTNWYHFDRLSEIEYAANKKGDKGKPYTSTPAKKQEMTAEMLAYKNRHQAKQKRKKKSSLPAVSSFIAPMTTLENAAEAAAASAAATNATTRDLTGPSNSSGQSPLHASLSDQSKEFFNQQVHEEKARSQEDHSDNNTNSLRRFRDLKKNSSLNPAEGETVTPRNIVGRARNFMGKNTGKVSQTAGNATRSLGRAAGSAAKGAAKQLGKQAARAGGRLLAQGGIEIAAATSEFWGPVVLGIIIFILILLLIIVVIIVIILLLMGTNDSTTSTIPVTITKSVDKTAVPNPPSGQPGEEITYNISVSYPGQAQDIITTDPIPDNAEFVRSFPPASLELDSSNKKVVRAVWHANTAPAASSSATATPTSTLSAPQTIDINTYTQAPYFLPTPSNASVAISDKTIANANVLGAAVARNYKYLLSKAANPKYVDPFLSVIWTVAIEGTGADPYEWNCQDIPGKINNGCAGGFYSGGWQVGYGVQVAQAVSHLEDDFNAAYGSGSAGNAAKVQEVGQAVITNSANSSAGQITNPSTFPSETISALVSESKQGNTASQQAIALLLMDPNLGSISIALEIAGDIAGRDNWRASMESWGSSYSSNMQLFADRMKAVAEKYTGNGSLTSGGGGTSFAPQNYTVVLRVPAGVQDTYIINQASTQVIGGSGGNATTATNQSAPSLAALSIQKMFLPLPSEGNCSQTVTATCGRPGKWVTPKKIVLHTTINNMDAMGTYQYFAGGSENRGVGSHFIIGKDGQILQLVDMNATQVEVAYAVANYSDHISLEIVSPVDFTSKNDPPSAQYTAVLNLVRALMKQYNIPLGDLAYTWKSSADTKTPESDAATGVFGHYQLNPSTRSDPGSGFLKDIREEIKNSP